METLDHAVRLLVVAREVADAKQSHHATPHVGLELATTVGHKTERDTKAGHPCLHEGTSHSVSGDVRQWRSLGPLSEAVHIYDQVPVTPEEGQEAHNVYVDMLEPGGEWREGALRGADVACHLESTVLHLCLCRSK